VTHERAASQVEIIAIRIKNGDSSRRPNLPWQIIWGWWEIGLKVSRGEAYKPENRCESRIAPAYNTRSRNFSSYVRESIGIVKYPSDWKCGKMAGWRQTSKASSLGQVSKPPQL
jgi:hypothetical protein